MLVMGGGGGGIPPAFPAGGAPIGPIVGRGGGGGGAPEPMEMVGTCGGAGGGGGGSGDSGAPGVPPGVKDCFRGHVNFCTLLARNNRMESSRFSNNVARCTRVSAVSQITSLIASLESMRNKCCKMLRNGIPCGVSATC